MAPRRSPWPYLAHLPFVAWTFAGPLFFGLVPYFRDIAYYYYPNEVFLERSFREGVWPLWNPTSDAGAPFLTTDVAELVLVRATSALGALRFEPPLRPLPDELVSARGEATLPEVLEPLRLYELRDPLPRAFTVARFGVERDPQRLAARLEAPGHDPRAAVLLSEDPPPALAPLDARTGESAGEASVERVSAHELRVRTGGGWGFVVVSEGYHRDWQASASDGARPLLRANGRYWAIPTRGGGETITVRYRPSWRAPALAALALGALGVLALAAWPARRGTRGEPAA